VTIPDQASAGLVALDTDAASLAYRGRLTSSLAGQLNGLTWCLTFVTVGELTQWATIRSWGPRNRRSLDAWLDHFLIVNSSTQAAHLWGEIAGAGKRTGRTRPINDTWIAACCLAEGIPLATLKVKDYADLVDTHALTLITE
jgi:toxin FitB